MLIDSVLDPVFILANQKNRLMSKTTNYTLSLSKKIGKLWVLEDVTPFFKPFKTYYFQEMGHDICKVTTSGLEIREGRADYTSRLCVIGSELKEEKIAELFGL